MIESKNQIHLVEGETAKMPSLANIPERVPLNYR